MKATWVLTVSAIAALSAGSAVAASEAEPEAPAIVAPLERAAAVTQPAERGATTAADTHTLVVVSATRALDAGGHLIGLQYGAGNQDAPLESAISRLRTSPSRDLAVATWLPFLSTNPPYPLVDTTTAG